MINKNIIVFFNFIQTKYADTNFRWKLVNIYIIIYYYIIFILFICYDSFEYCKQNNFK